MRFENEKLREEMERLKKVLGPGPQGANQKLLQENALLVSQVGLIHEWLQAVFGYSDACMIKWHEWACCSALKLTSTSSRQQVKTLSSDKNRVQLAAEIAQLKVENESLKKGGGGGAGGSVKDAVKEFSNK